MTRSIHLITLIALTTSSFAQEVGEAAAEGAAQAKKESYWQNWVYAGTAIALAVIGIVVVSWDPGHAKPAP